ncbi:putative transporter [Oscillibacter valericigenes Sjm18-20]|nr:putative transporter [Oscillibacter valericigenes Sjm18-20]
MKALNQIVDGLTRFVMGISAATVFVITFAQVLCRYVLKSPLPWSTDILRLAFTYLVFWGAAWCVREKGNLNVDVVLTAMPVKMRKAVEILINIILCAFFIFLMVYGGQFAKSGLSQSTSYLPIPMTVYYASIPSAALVMLFYMVQILVGQVRDFNRKEAGEK